MGLWDVSLNQAYDKIWTFPSVPKTQLGALSLQTNNELKTNFEEVFQDVSGLCTKMKATIIVHPDAKPVFLPKRPAPYAVVDKLEEKYERLQMISTNHDD